MPAGGETPPTAPIASETPPAVPEALDERGLAEKFLTALRAAEPSGLRPLACPTFQFRSSARADKCSGTASTAEELDRLIQCVRSDPTLQQELEYASGLASSATSIPALPDWAAPLVTAGSRARSATSAYINGDGVTFRFVLLDNGACVEWLLLAAEFESG